VFQLLLGQDIAFNVPVLSFVLLVAVGADYNILLMSRIRENRGSLTPAVVGRAVTATGPVITSAGIIFACTFLPMTTSSLASLAQLCFAVVIGLLLDTFVVRTLIVPSMAAVLGDSNWWPARRHLGTR
jgi:RND superfamily putative drug exporter